METETLKRESKRISPLFRLICTCRPRPLRTAVEMHEASPFTYYNARCILRILLKGKAMWSKKKTVNKEARKAPVAWSCKAIYEASCVSKRSTWPA